MVATELVDKILDGSVYIKAEIGEDGMPRGKCEVFRFTLVPEGTYDYNDCLEAVERVLGMLEEVKKFELTASWHRLVVAVYKLDKQYYFYEHYYGISSMHIFLGNAGWDGNALFDYATELENLIKTLLPLLGDEQAVGVIRAVADPLARNPLLPR